MTTNSPLPGMFSVTLTPKSLTTYAPIVGEETIAAIRSLAEFLRGAHVLHISATAHGGGVAALLQTLVPLMRDVGIDAEWRIITASDDFFVATKRIHNGLQGMPQTFTPDMQAIYMATNRSNVATLIDDFDFVIVHDPQPAAMLVWLPHQRGTWIWRCHLDLSHPSPGYWDFMRPLVQLYDAAIFTTPAFVPSDLQMKHVSMISPTIDPLTVANAPLPRERTDGLIAARGIDPARPLLIQVSRFDPWKDPLGVIESFRVARQEFPDLQLVLLGELVRDDPEGIAYYQHALASAGSDPDIHILLNSGGAPEVNAFQQSATVILQKSLREGFGMTVTEGLWKARPVIGSNVGGIPLQIEDGVTGFLVEHTEQAAERIMEVMRDPVASAAMGMRGREKVRQQFLSPANLSNYVKLFQSLRA